MLSSLAQGLNPLRTLPTRSSEAASFTKIGRLDKEMPQKLESLITALIVDLVDSFNLPADRRLTAAQTMNAAIMIIQDWRLYSLEDIALCFRNIKTGKYGPAYGRMGIDFIFECLRRYDYERTEELENEHMKLSKQSDKEAGETAEAMKNRGIEIMAMLEERFPGTVTDTDKKEAEYAQYRERYIKECILRQKKDTPDENNLSQKLEE